MSGTPVWLQHPNNGCIAEIDYAQIELREGYTDLSNNWTIKSVTALLHGTIPISQTSPTVNGQSSNPAHCGIVYLIART